MDQKVVPGRAGDVLGVRIRQECVVGEKNGCVRLTGVIVMQMALRERESDGRTRSSLSYLQIGFLIGDVRAECAHVC